MSGKVYLVGAGPGDPGLITVRGVACLRLADTVVYDRLAASALLDYAPAGAMRVYAGKAAGDRPLSQGDISRLLVREARLGNRVVRLKGGDPFVFGRGGEEALALAEAGVPFEVVPGVSSAVAVPAYAGIPVTHRGVAASVTVRTGHRAPGNGPTGCGEGPEGTVVYLMGVENLATIVAELRAERWAPGTPTALIRWGTTARQATVIGSLGDIVERSAGLLPPAVLVVGPVVALRDRLDWFERRPLAGKRIVVTRAQAQAGETAALLAEQGATVVEFPTISIQPLADTATLDAALLRPHDWVIFTSVNGVRAVWSRLRALGRDARAFGQARLCAIGTATAAALTEHGLHADFVPGEFVAEAVVSGLHPVVGQRVLWPRAETSRPALADGLRRRGARVDEVVAYRTIVADRGHPQAGEIAAQMEAGEIAAIAFTSSSTVRGFVAALGLDADAGPGARRWPYVACIGPVTAETARALGVPVDVVAQTYNIPGLICALVSHFTDGEERG